MEGNSTSSSSSCLFFIKPQSHNSLLMALYNGNVQVLEVSKITSDEYGKNIKNE